MAQKTIILIGQEFEIRSELKANAAITPGHLVEFASDGDVQVHSTANGTAMRAFALENDLEGEEIDTAYAAADRVQVAHLPPGSVIYALITNGQSITKGDFLVSGGDGTLRKAPVIDSGSDIVQGGSIVGQALDTVDMSGSDAVDPSGRCAIRLM